MEAFHYNHTICETRRPWKETKQRKKKTTRRPQLLASAMLLFGPGGGGGLKNEARRPFNTTEAGLAASATPGFMASFKLWRASRGGEKETETKRKQRKTQRD